MSRNPSSRLILTGAIAAAAAFAAPWIFAVEARFEPALKASGGQKQLMTTNVKLARAETEAGPFRNRIDTGRPLPDDTGDVQQWNDPGDRHLRVTSLEPERL